MSGPNGTANNNSQDTCFIIGSGDITQHHSTIKMLDVEVKKESIDEDKAPTDDGGNSLFSKSPIVTTGGSPMNVNAKEELVNISKKIPIPLVNFDKSIDQRNSLEFRIS